MNEPETYLTYKLCYSGYIMNTMQVFTLNFILTMHTFSLGSFAFIFPTLSHALRHETEI